jgi:hypothetical protein
MKKRSKTKGQAGKTHWPSLEKQLHDSKVIPGSALEQFIRQNQDFSTLRPEEAHDDLPFPPWLRVYWRKMHPELNYSGPEVGYPLLLKDIGLRMLRNQDLPQGPPVAPGASGDAPQNAPKRRGRGQTRS